MAIEWTPWSQPGVLKSYKYKGYIIEYIEQTSTSIYSTHYHHEFRALKGGKVVTNGHRRYSDCVWALKRIINK